MPWKLQASYVSVCPVGRFGVNCAHSCHCIDRAPCNAETGTCSSPGCVTGWTGPACDTGEILHDKILACLKFWGYALYPFGLFRVSRLILKGHVLLYVCSYSLGGVVTFNQFNALKDPSQRHKFSCFPLLSTILPKYIQQNKQQLHGIHKLRNQQTDNVFVCFVPQFVGFIRPYCIESLSCLLWLRWLRQLF